MNLIQSCPLDILWLSQRDSSVDPRSLLVDHIVMCNAPKYWMIRDPTWCYQQWFWTWCWCQTLTSFTSRHLSTPLSSTRWLSYFSLFLCTSLSQIQYQLRKAWFEINLRITVLGASGNCGSDVNLPVILFISQILLGRSILLMTSKMGNSTTSKLKKQRRSI